MPSEAKAAPMPGGDSPACDVCGTITVRSGVVFKCLNCGQSMPMAPIPALRHAPATEQPQHDRPPLPMDAWLTPHGRLSFIAIAPCPSSVRVRMFEIGEDYVTDPERHAVNRALVREFRPRIDSFVLGLCFVSIVLNAVLVVVFTRWAAWMG